MENVDQNSSRHICSSFNLFLFPVLFGSTIFVNKYVLSVLNFTYPTIFQGWQTLVGGIFLKIILANKYFGISSTELDISGFISLLPILLFYSSGIVASSKALAGLSIPIYLGLQNTVGAILYLLKIAQASKECISPLHVSASLIVVASAIASLFAEIDMTFSDTPFFWMVVYLACLLVQSLHSKQAGNRYSETDCLYFCYIFSVLILAPASLYLEEAFEVLKFPNASRYDFYVGCLLSGLLGLFLNLSLIRFQHHSHFQVADGVGRMMISALSLLLFSDSNSLIATIFISINLSFSVMVPGKKTWQEVKDAEELKEPL